TDLDHLGGIERAVVPAPVADAVGGWVSDGHPRVWGGRRALLLTAAPGGGDGEEERGEGGESVARHGRPRATVGDAMGKYRPDLTGLTLLARRLPGEDGVEEFVCLLAHRRREVVPAVGVLDAEAVGLAVQLEHQARRRGDLVHAVGPEVV